MHSHSRTHLALFVAQPGHLQRSCLPGIGTAGTVAWYVDGELLRARSSTAPGVTGRRMYRHNSAEAQSPPPWALSDPNGSRQVFSISVDSASFKGLPSVKRIASINVVVYLTISLVPN